MIVGAARNQRIALGLARTKRGVTASKRSQSLLHTSSSVQKEVFGIDFGNKITRVAVVDPTTRKVKIVKNLDDGTNYWHTAVAYDTSSNQFVVGKRAKNLIFSGDTHVAHGFKHLIGARYGGAALKKYNKQFGPFVAKASRGSGDSIVLSLSGGQRLTPVDLAAEVFKSIRRACHEYSQSTGSTDKDPIEAYITVPPSFSDEQREAIVTAGSLAGINIIQVVEEPIAALYGVKRLEQTGNYHIVDFGDHIRSYVVRTVDGKIDVLRSTEHDYTELAGIVKKAQHEYVIKQTKKRLDKQDFALLLSEQINDELIDAPEWVPTDSSVRRQVPYFSRESRQIRTFQPIFEHAQHLLEEVRKPLLKGGLDMDRITHPILVGGGSMAFPEVARTFERVHNTRLGDLVAPADQSMAVGLAVRAAEDRGVLKTPLAGKRSLDAKGHLVTTPKNLIDTHLQEYKQALTFVKDSVTMPSPVPFSYENIASTLAVEPLYPEYRSDENPRRPEPAVSYAQKKDPISGKIEHWARVTVKAPHLPKEDFERPDLKIVFVINVTGTPLVDGSRSLPEGVTDWDSLQAAAKAAGDTPLPREALQTGNSAGFDAAARRFEKEAKYAILKKVEEMKKENGVSYRTQNRAIEAIQVVMGEMDVRRDFVGAVVIGGGPGATGVSTKAVQLQRMFHADKEGLVRTLKYSDCSGRSSERYADAIRAAHNVFLQHNDSPAPDPDLPPAPGHGEYDEYHMSPAELAEAARASVRPPTKISIAAPTQTEEGKEGAAAPAENKEADSSKKKKPARQELRIVMVTDSPPDPSVIQDVESALADATKDDVLTTIISIDGPEPEGKYHVMQSRIRGMKTLRWFRQNVHAHPFREKWLTHKDLLQRYFMEPTFRSVVVKIEFDNYNIAKLYGGNLTSNERIRGLERSPTGSVKVKYGSIDTTYPHDPADPALDWTPQPDNLSMLFKLEPKSAETRFERELRIAQDAPAAKPSSDTALSTFVSNDFSPQGKVAFGISYLDGSGEKKEYSREIWLADNAVPGYADENGIENLIWAAKFADFFKSAIHNRLAAPLADQVVALPLPSKDVGVPHFNQKTEDQLLKNYAADSSEVVLLMNQMMELKRSGSAPLSDEMRMFMDVMYGLYVQTRARQLWLEGRDRDSNAWSKMMERDPIVSLVWALREAYFGQRRPTPVVSFFQAIGMIRRGLAERKKTIQAAEGAIVMPVPKLFEPVLKVHGDGNEVWNEREMLEGQTIDLIHKISKMKHPYEKDFNKDDYAARAAFWLEDYDTMWKHMRNRVQELDKDLQISRDQRKDALKAYLAGAAEPKFNPMDGRPQNIVAYTSILMKDMIREESREEKEWRGVVEDRKKAGTYKPSAKVKAAQADAPKRKKKKSRRSKKKKESESTETEENVELPETEEELRKAAEAEDRAEAEAEQREKEKRQKQLDTYERLLRRKLLRVSEMNESDKAELVFGGRHRPIDIVEFAKRYGKPTMGRSRALAIMKRPEFALFYEKNERLRKMYAMQHYLSMRMMLGLPEQLRQKSVRVPGPRVIGKDRYVFSPQHRGIPAWNLAPDTITTDELEGIAAAYIKYGLKSVIMPPESWKLFEKHRSFFEWELRSYIAFLRGEEFSEPEPPASDAPFHYSGYDKLPLSDTDIACIPSAKRRSLLRQIRQMVPPLTHPEAPGGEIGFKGYLEAAVQDHKELKPAIMEMCFSAVAEHRAAWIPKRIAQLKSQISWLKSSSSFGILGTIANFTSKFLGVGDAFAKSFSTPPEGTDAKIAVLEEEIKQLESELPRAEELHQIVFKEKVMSATDAMKKIFPDRFMDERALRALKLAQQKLLEEQKSVQYKKALKKPLLPEGTVPPKWLLRRWRKKMSPEKWNKTAARVKKLYKARKEVDVQKQKLKEEQLAKKAAEEQKKKAQEAEQAAAKSAESDSTSQNTQSPPASS